MSRSRDRPTFPYERATSDRLARERARGERYGRPPPRRFPRLYLPDNL